MRIAISGQSGCGNTTISTMVSQQLGIPVVNYTFRNLAKEKGVDFSTICHMAQQDDDIDRQLDERQIRLAMAYKDCILASRLAIWLLKDADLKVYLRARVEERARRIQQREGGTFDQRLKETIERDRRDSERYLRIYGINNADPTGTADLILDTDGMQPEEVAALIVDEVRKRQGLIQ